LRDQAASFLRVPPVAGLSSAAYAVFLGATTEAFQTNATILEALISVNNKTRALENAVNGADTVVDLWEGGPIHGYVV
jgi:hypothetical protein